MLENILRFFLACSHEIIIIPLVIIGYIWLDRKVFFHGICLLLTSMLLNLALKSSFRIPLSPALGKEGFAFPSGHMQSSLVFYGWLFKSTNQFLIKIGITVLLIGIGVGLLYFGYHGYLDIFGALFFGLLLIGTYHGCLKYCRPALLPILIFLFSTVFMIYISWVYEVKEYSWMAYYALIGIVSSDYCFRNKIPAINNVFKMKATVFCLLVFVLMNKIFTVFTQAPCTSQLKWLLIAYSIPFSLYFVSVIRLKKQGLYHDQ